MESPGFYREKDLLKPNINGDRIFPGSHSSLWRFVAEGRFPKPLKISPRMTVWRAEDIHSWAREQASQS